VAQNVSGGVTTYKKGVSLAGERWKESRAWLGTHTRRRKKEGLLILRRLEAKQAASCFAVIWLASTLCSAIMKKSGFAGECFGAAQWKVAVHPSVYEFDPCEIRRFYAHLAAVGAPAAIAWA